MLFVGRTKVAASRSPAVGGDLSASEGFDVRGRLRIKAVRTRRDTIRGPLENDASQALPTQPTQHAHATHLSEGSGCWVAEWGGGIVPAYLIDRSIDRNTYIDRWIDR